MNRTARLAQMIIDHGSQTGEMVTTAESCTGGLVSAAITDLAGSSAALDRSFVTYTNAAKHQMLGVSTESLDRFGAVSEAVAKEMAYGALANSQAAASVAITGVAGPGGGTADKPVGTVWFASARLGEAPTAKLMQFGDLSRAEIRAQSVETALALLAEALGLGLD